MSAAHRKVAGPKGLASVRLTYGQLETLKDSDLFYLHGGDLNECLRHILIEALILMKLERAAIESLERIREEEKNPG